MTFVKGTECELCGSTRHLHVDHDHDTGRIRGTLCVLCNHALGKFRDNPALLRAGADYLEREPTEHTWKEWRATYNREWQAKNPGYHTEWRRKRKGGQ